MVAIVTGNGLGLERTSAWLLGARGQLGVADFGRSGEDVFVNAANGNLIVSQRDEMLVGLGPDSIINRTYNSRGALTDDNGDNWRMSFSRQVGGLTGTMNTAGSTITRTDWDGGEVVYAWHAASNAYRTVEGQGAHDTLKKVGATWEWTDGDTRIKEIYSEIGATGVFRLTSQVDLDGNTVTFAYTTTTSTLVNRVTTADGGYTTITYSGTKITEMATYATAGGSARKTVRYSYDGSNRLSAVTVDLTPDNNSITDGVTYVTTYGYDANGRVSSIGQTDGSSLTISYDGSGRVASLVQAVSAGVNRTTTFDYSVAGQTSVTAAGLTTTLKHVTGGQFGGGLLTEIIAPPPVSGGASLVTKFYYDADDNLVGVRDPSGRLSIMRPVNSGGNTTGLHDVVRDSGGVTTWRTFGANNELLTESRFTTPDGIGAGAPDPAGGYAPQTLLDYIAAELDKAGTTAPTGAQTTRYVYDANNHLRFTVSATGRVSEQVWNSAGLMVRARVYTADFRSLSGLGPSDTLSLATMTAWADARTDATVAVTDYAYDVRGALDYTIAYAASVTGTDGFAIGHDSGAQTRTDYIYDHRGRLIERFVDGRPGVETYIYDGLDRLTASTDASGNTTHIRFQDASGVTVLSQASGLDRISTFNLAGELISTSEVERSHVNLAGWPTNTSSPPSGTATIEGWQNTSTFLSETRWTTVTGPSGTNVVAIEAGQLDTAVQGGGHRTNRMTLDGTKAYEFTFYFRKSDLTRHDLYFRARSDSTLPYLENAVSGADAANPTFYYASPTTQAATLQNDRWYKVVGYILPEGSALISSGAIGGVFDMTTGQKVANTSNFRWNPERRDNEMDATMFLYGGADTASWSTYFYQPEVREVGLPASYASTPPATTYKYDNLGRLRMTTDPTGKTSHILYDDLGRKVADIAADGSMVEYGYDADGRLVRTVRFANRLSTAQMNTLVDGSGNPQAVDITTFKPTANASKDNWEWRVYDASGRLAYTVDGRGAVATYTYDGASRLIASKAMWSRFAAATVTGFKTTPPDLSTVLPTTNLTNDRPTRYFYDADGRLEASLDADGYLTRTFYDAAGRVVQQSAYHTKSTRSDSQRATDSLATLIGSVAANAAKDIHVWTIYDQRGLVTATINGEGDLVRYQYDAAGYVSQEVRGQRVTLPTPLTVTGVLTGLPTLADLPTPATGDVIETVNYTRDTYGRVLTETKVLASGSDVTTYRYDALGQLVGRTTTPASGAARTDTFRYDAQGRLIGELPARGAAALAALGAAATAAQIDAVYRAYGTTYAYDDADRLISKTSPDGSGQSHKTFYYYDAANRLVFDVNGAGEVKERRYDGQGRLTDVIDHEERIGVGSLTGGLNTAQVTVSLTAADRRNQFAYDVAGNLTSQTSARGVVTTHTYTSYRQLLKSTVTARGGYADDVTRDIDFTYDRRANLKTEKLDAAGLNYTTTYDTDAFGRRTQVTDAGGRVRTTQYDRAGRIVELKDGNLQITTFTYDGRGHVLTRTDRTGQTTSFSYDAFNRTVTTTTPETIVTVTTNNAFGQTVSIGVQGSVVGDGLRTFTYDVDGNLLTQDDGSGVVRTFTYDQAGRLASETDEDNRKIQYDYDAASRVLTRTVDPTGLNLRTRYAYDAFGQTVDVTEAYGTSAATVTRTEFDLDGHRTAVIRDHGAGRLNLRTEFKTDNAGRVYEVIEGAGSAEAVTTRHTFDKADRRTKTQVDPSGLNLTTEYFYDSASNVRAVKDARGNLTRYLYDGEDRVYRRVEADGTIYATTYDGEGRVVWQVRYATKLNLSGLPTIADNSQTAPVSAAGDRYEFHAYDKDGRLRFHWKPGLLTEQVYSARGDLIRSTGYSSSLPQPVTWTYDGLKAAVEAPGFAKAQDRSSLSTYDGAGRLLYEADAEGYVTQRLYSPAGRLTEVRRHTPKLAAGVTPSHAALLAVDSAYAGKASVESYGYDSAGRVTSVTNALGVVTLMVLDELDRAVQITTASGTSAAVLTARQYDGAGRLTSETRGTGTAESTRQLLIYDALDRTTQVTTGLAATNDTITTRVYDKAGRLTSETRAAGNSYASTKSWTYDANGNVVKITDGRNKVGYFHYDELNRVTLQVDPEGYVTRTEYLASAETGEAGFEVTRITRYWNRATTIGNETTPPTVVTHDKDAVTEIVKDGEGRVVRLTDAEAYRAATSEERINRSERYQYNGFSDRTTVINKLGASTTYTFDRRGQVLTETLPITSANASNVQVAVQNAYAYNAFGQVTTRTEAVGLPEQRITTYAYDKLGQLTETKGEAVTVTHENLSTTSSVQPTETRTYDARGNVISITDAGGARTLYYYDLLDRKIGEIDALGGYRRFEYDANNNLTKTLAFGTAVTPPSQPGGAPPTVPGGVVREVRYSYDDLNRLTETKVLSVLWGVLTGTGHQYAVYTSDLTASQTYDAMGNVTSRTDQRGLTTYHYYDAVGREIARVDQLKYLTVWTRDAEGNVLSETRYATVLTGTITAETQPAPPTTHADDRTTVFTYDRNGRRLTEARQNVLAYSVNPTTGVLSSATTAATITYTYDALGNVLSKTEANGDATSYVYDNIGRLTKATGPQFTDHTGATVQRTTETSYDGLNNVIRTREGKPVADSAIDRVTTFTYVKGRLATMTDANGFVRTYGYDAAGRVVKDAYVRTKSDGTTVTEAVAYRYDALGRQTWQAMATLGGSTWSFGDSNQSQYNVFGEVTARGLNGLWQETFEYDMFGRMWRSTAGDGTLKFYLHDKNGNVTYQVASAGADLSAVNTQGKLLNLLSVAVTTDAATGATDIGQNAVAGVTLTGYAYTWRNQLSHTYETFRELNVNASNPNLNDTQSSTKTRAYNAFGEVVSEKDARGNVSYFIYNTMGRLTQKRSPTVSVTAETGAVSNVTPDDFYYFDVSGRLIAVQDANDNVTRRTLLAGSGHGEGEAIVLKQFNTDNSSTRVEVDVFGDVRKSYDGLNNLTQYAYDKMGRLITLTRPTRGQNAYYNPTGALTLVESYRYDGLGQRIRQWNSQLGADVGGGQGRTVEQRTDYDAQGRVVRHEAFGGVVTTTAYAWGGSIATTGLGTFGGWTRTTTHASGKQGVETLDYFGRLVAKTDLGARTYAMTFDKGGRLTQQTSSAGQNLTYQWFNTGALAKLTDGSGQLQFGVNSANVVSTYAYDVDGNRLREKMVSTTYFYYVDDWDGTPVLDTSTVVNQDATVTWDALNRMVSFEDVSVSATDPLRIDYAYDEVGNVRRVKTDWRQVDGTDRDDLDYWYRYDAMNRMTTVKGVFTGSAGSGTISRGKTGTDLSYDAAGRRATMTQTRDGMYVTGGYWEWTDPFTFPEEEEPLNPNDPNDNWEWVNTYGYFDKQYQETYTYTEDGYLGQVQVRQEEWNTTTQAPAWGSQLVRGYDIRDAMGRLTYHAETDQDGVTLVQSRTTVWDDRSQVTTDTVDTRVHVNNVWKTQRVVSTYQYNAETSSGSGVWTGAYMDGAVTYQQSASQYLGESGSLVTSSTRTLYQWWDSARQSTVTHDENINASGTNHVSTFNYDVNGKLTYVNIQDGRPRTVTYVTDAQGQVLTRSEASAATENPITHSYFFQGQKVGEVTNDGHGAMDYVSVILRRRMTQTPGPFYFLGAVHDADFDQAYDPINPDSVASSARVVTVRDGDTLQSIARSVWGDASLWWMLADANGLDGTETLEAGRSLIVPPKVANFHNNSETFRPYDPNKAIGETSPYEPKPAQKPKDNDCAGVGKVIAVVIAVAVVIATKGAATKLMAGLLKGMGVLSAGAIKAGAIIGGGALAGAAGSVASQAFSVAVGIQDKFDWKAVGLAAVSGGVGARLGMVGSGPLAGDGFAASALRGMTGSAISQGIGVATGLQDRFDWTAVAVAGVTSGVSAHVGMALPKDWIPVATDFASGMAGGVAGAATRSLIEGTSFGDNLLAALPDIIGSTIGNSVAKRIGAHQASHKKPAGPSQDEAASMRPVATGGVGGLSLEPAALAPDEAALLLARDRALYERAAQIAAENAPELVRTTDHAPDPAAFLRRFTNGTNGDVDAIQDNISAYLERVGAQARERYPLDGNIMSALAQNEALVQFYSSLALEVPDFQWTYVGGFMAHQVRDEILNIYHSSNLVGAISAFLPAGGNIPVQAGGAGLRDYLISELIAGQRDVVSDIGSMALAYRMRGAEAVRSDLSSRGRITAADAFALQSQADAHRREGRMVQAADLGRRAAIQLGVVEQTRLQRMWNDPALNAFARANAYSIERGWTAIARPLEIYVGVDRHDRSDPFRVRYIRPPDSVSDNPNAADLRVRLRIAENAFNEMHDSVFAPRAAGNSQSFLAVQRAFTQLLNPSNLYPAPRPLVRWPPL